MHGQVRAADRILAETASDVESRMKSDKNVLAILRSLDEMPLSTKRSSLLFIPQSNRQFWDLLHGPYWPADVPLVACMSGVAMIDGLHVPKEAAKEISGTANTRGRRRFSVSRRLTATCRSSSGDAQAWDSGS